MTAGLRHFGEWLGGRVGFYHTGDPLNVGDTVTAFGVEWRWDGEAFVARLAPERLVELVDRRTRP